MNNPLENFKNPFDIGGDFANNILDTSRFLGNSFFKPFNEVKDTNYPNGTFYNIDGSFASNLSFVKNNKNLNNDVYIINPEKSMDRNRRIRSQIDIIFDSQPYKLLGLTHNELLDRANWAYGESHGKILNYYAHAINNARKAGKTPVTPFENEKALKEMLFQDETHSYPSILTRNDPKYGGNDNPNTPETFWEARQKGIPLKFYNPLTQISGQDCIREIIQAVLGITQDFTNGATLWGHAVQTSQYATAEITLKPEQTDGVTIFYKWKWH